MKTIRCILFSGVLGFLVVPLHAQELPEPSIHSSSYHTGIGLRAGETSGLTVKQFVANRHALEFIAGIWHHGFSGTLMYEHYSPAFNVDGLNWYYGIGGHGSYQTGHEYLYYNRNRYYYAYGPGNFGIGLDGIFGMEFKIPSAPLAVSMDFKPYLEFVSNGTVRGALDPGLGIKAVF